MKDISVIIPCSRQDTIEACVKSLLDSDLKNISLEIIIIVLQEVDITKLQAIGQKEKSVSLKIISSKINHPSLMRNLGVAQSTGKFLVFLDDDTILSKHWLRTCLRILKTDPEKIICGPNIDQREGFGYVIANAINSVYISEGLRTHQIKNISKVDFHNIPLNNCAFSRKIFDKIGGFNDRVDYYLDDVEFFYIAHRLGYKFFQYPELVIQHHCRKFPIDFFRHKFYARKKIGYNAFFFRELYKDNFVIRLILLSYLLLPLFIYFLFGKHKEIILSLFFLYAVIVIGFSLGLISKNLKYIFVPIGIFLNHLVGYFGFTCGLIKGLININKYQEIKKIKKNRYVVFRHQGN